MFPTASGGSVILREEHLGDRPFPFAAAVVSDDPERAVLGREVAGEEAAVVRAGGLVVGGLVVLAEVAPITSGMAIEQGGDLVVS